jgi:hypothetical protein
VPTLRRWRGSWPGSTPALVVVGGAAGVLVLYWHLIGFSTFVSDPLGYWADSLYWREPYNAFHLAGFPLLLAAARGATFDSVDPVTLMTTIAIAALLVGVHGTYRLARLVGLSERTSIAAATGFGLWPFVGTVYAAFPVADPLVLALVVWGAVYAVRGIAAPAGLCLGLAAVTHKSVWPTVALIVVGTFLWVGRSRRFAVTTAALALVPPLALWIAGVATGQRVTWLVSSSASDGVAPLHRDSLPIFDGLVGNVVYGDGIGRARAVVAFVMVALALVVLLSNMARWREPFPWIASVFALQVLGLALVMNQHLVWSAVRFGGLLAVPAATLVARRIDSCPPARWHLLAGVAVVLLVGTQLLTAWEGSSRGWLGIL